MNIGAAEIGLIVHINQQQKEKIANMEKEKIRFQTLMAQVKMSYEKKIETLQVQLKKLALIMALTGQGGLFQMSQSNDGENDQKSEKGDELQGSGSINQSQDIGQSVESVEANKEKVITELKELNQQLMRRLNEQREQNGCMEQDNKLQQPSICLKDNDSGQKIIQQMQTRLEECHNQLKNQKQKSQMMVREISRLQNIIQKLSKELNKQQLVDVQIPTLPSMNRQSSDLYEKSELKEELNKILVSDKQHQSEIDEQIKKIVELEESMRTLRRQKDAEITNLKKEFEDAENRYETEMVSIRHALESSRMKTDYEAQQIKTLLKNQEIKGNSIENHLQHIFENRKDRIAKGQKQNTYDDLAQSLINIVRGIYNRYQATIKP